jgi:hypothetical protein
MLATIQLREEMIIMNLNFSLFIHIGKRMFILLPIFLIGSCNSIYTKLIGIHPNQISNNPNNFKIICQTEKYFSNYSQIAYLDSSFIDDLYFAKNEIIDTSEKKYLIKRLMQPLSLLIFDSNSKLNTIIANCDADNKGLNLTWNYYFKSDHIDSNEILKSNIKFDFFKTHFIPLKSNKSYKNKKIIVFWSTFMGRQANNFLKEISEYYKTKKDVEINIVSLDFLYWSKTNSINYK